MGTRKRRFSKKSLLKELGNPANLKCVAREIRTGAIKKGVVQGTVYYETTTNTINKVREQLEEKKKVKGLDKKVQKATNNTTVSFARTEFFSKFYIPEDEFRSAVFRGDIIEENGRILVPPDSLDEITEQYLRKKTRTVKRSISMKNITRLKRMADNREGYFIDGETLAEMYGIRPEELDEVITLHKPYSYKDNSRTLVLVTQRLALLTGLDFPPRLGDVVLDQDPYINYDFDELFFVSNVTNQFDGEYTEKELQAILEKQKVQPVRGKGERTYVLAQVKTAVKRYKRNKTRAKKNKKKPRIHD